MVEISCIEAALKQYIEHATTRVNSSVSLSGSARWEDLRSERVEELRSQVRFAENDPSFDALVSAVSNGQGSVFVAWDMETFLRRSGTYLTLYRGEAVDLGTLTERLIKCFHSDKRAIRTRYLAPIHSIWFSDSVDLGDFRIDTFSAMALAEILDSSNNAVFYPGSSGTVDRLSDYWFIDATFEQSLDRRILDDLVDPSPIFDSNALDAVDRRFTDFSEPIQQAVQVLALWDWENSLADRPVHQKGHKPIDKGAHWYKFSVPTVLRISDDWLSRPQLIPAVPGIQFEPHIDADGNEDGEEARYEYDVWDAHKFESCLRPLGHLIERSKLRKEWSFVPLALGFLTKALFAKDLEELLWHIVVLEALVGEGINKMTSRLKAILGYDSVEERLKELYTFRSKFVHGTVGYLNMEVYQGHLREARRIARLALIYFLHYVGATDMSMNNGLGFVPERRDLLHAIEVSSLNPSANNHSIHHHAAIGHDSAAPSTGREVHIV